MIKNHMLVVEDNISLQRSVIKDIKRWFPSYEVEGVDSFEAARNVLRRNRSKGVITRVIIVDEKLKGSLRGSDLVAYVDRYYPGIRKIMLAALARVIDLSKALNKGDLDKYILKDEYEDNPNALREAIQSALREKRGFIYDAITELLSKAEKEGHEEPVILAAGKRQLKPADLLREITHETKLGRDHMKNFAKLVYSLFTEPDEFLRELEKVSKLREKAKSAKHKKAHEKKKDAKS